MRLRSALVLFAVVGATLSACDSNTTTTCPDTGLVTVADSAVGSGQAAFPTASVSVLYVGRLAATGVRFDSSAAPVRFSLTNVVTGFRQGIGGRAATNDAPAIAPMRIGGRRVIRVPSAYGYGAFERPGIPACSDLIFDVTLVDL